MEHEPNIEQPTAGDAQLPEDAEEQYDSPRGAFNFVILMLIGFALYWAFIWLTVMSRSAGV